MFPIIVGGYCRSMINSPISASFKALFEKPQHPPDTLGV